MLDTGQGVCQEKVFPRTYALAGSLMEFIPVVEWLGNTPLMQPNEAWRIESDCMGFVVGLGSNTTLIFFSSKPSFKAKV